MTLAELAAKGLRVKPLVWHQDEPNDYWAAIEGTYYHVFMGQSGEGWIAERNWHRLDPLDWMQFSHQAQVSAEAHHAQSVADMIETIEVME